MSPKRVRWVWYGYGVMLQCHRIMKNCVLGVDLGGHNQGRARATVTLENISSQPKKPAPVDFFEVQLEGCGTCLCIFDDHDCDVIPAMRVLGSLACGAGWVRLVERMVRSGLRCAAHPRFAAGT